MTISRYCRWDRHYLHLFSTVMLLLNLVASCYQAFKILFHVLMNASNSGFINICFIGRKWLLVSPSKPSCQNCTHIKIIQFENEISNWELYSCFVLTSPFVVFLGIGLHCLIVLNKSDYKNRRQLYGFLTYRDRLLPLVICEVFPE